MRSVEIMIPVYKPGPEFEELLRRLEKQTYPIERICIVNTQEEYWDKDWEKKYEKLHVTHITKEEFDHGGTRRAMAEASRAEIMVYMTQDALPKNRELIARLVEALEEGPSQAAYARQLPAKDCRLAEAYTRSFNYPAESRRKTKADLPEMGIKTYFCSNVCAAYERKIYEKLGGFPKKAIFNEDMIYAGKLIQAGYAVCYQAEAQVIHSHNYGCMQQLRRNFDLGVSQAQNPETFRGLPSEGEGIRLVISTIEYLCRKGKIWMIPRVILQSGFKYAGYQLGKHYEKLPGWMIRRCTMNREYWR